MHAFDRHFMSDQFFSYRLNRFICSLSPSYSSKRDWISSVFFPLDYFLRSVALFQTFFFFSFAIFWFNFSFLLLVSSVFWYPFLLKSSFPLYFSLSSLLSFFLSSPSTSVNKRITLSLSPKTDYFQFKWKCFIFP